MGLCSRSGWCYCGWLYWFVGYWGVIMSLVEFCWDLGCVSVDLLLFIAMFVFIVALLLFFLWFIPRVI